MSYNGKVDFGLLGDYDAMPDLEDFGDDARGRRSPSCSRRRASAARRGASRTGSRRSLDRVPLASPVLEAAKHLLDRPAELERAVAPPCRRRCSRGPSSRRRRGRRAARRRVSAVISRCRWTRSGQVAGVVGDARLRASSRTKSAVAGVEGGGHVGDVGLELEAAGEVLQGDAHRRQDQATRRSAASDLK